MDPEDVSHDCPQFRVFFCRMETNEDPKLSVPGCFKRIISSLHQTNEPVARQDEVVRFEI